MKKKIGTIIDDGLLGWAKQRAALERRSFSGVIEEALNKYLAGDPAREDALRALAKFTAENGLLPPEEIDEILKDDTLTP